VNFVGTQFNFNQVPKQEDKENGPIKTLLHTIFSQNLILYEINQGRGQYSIPHHGIITESRIK